MKFSKSIGFETGPASPRTTAIALAFAAIVILLIAIFVSRAVYEFDTTGQRTEGEVIGHVDTGDNMYSAVFRFVDEQGSVHTVRDRVRSSRKEYDVGDKVAIVYNRGQPSGARKDGALSLYFGPAIMGLMSLLFFVVAGLVWRFRSHFQRDYESRRGKTVVTVVNNDGTVTQTTHSSVPVFRATGIFLALLGAAAWLGGFAAILKSLGADTGVLMNGNSIALITVGSLLLVGAAVSLRHARFLKSLEEATSGAD